MAINSTLGQTSTGGPSQLSRPHQPETVSHPPSEPDTEQGGERHQREKQVQDDQNGRRQARHVRVRWWGANKELSPDASDEAEGTKQDEGRAGGNDHPAGDETFQELTRADAAGERHEARSHPGRIGALGREHGAVGREFGAAVGAVLGALGSLSGALRRRLGLTGAVLDLLVNRLHHLLAPQKVKASSGRAVSSMPT